MKVKDPERTLYMYMSDRLKSRAWGVHVRAGLDLTTLCGMKFDDNGDSLDTETYFGRDVIKEAHGEPVSCPQCILTIAEIQKFKLDIRKAAIIERERERDRASHPAPSAKLRSSR
jgi:hypothetical protein